MNTLGSISANDAISLYHEKHNAFRQSDFNSLIKLKTKYPELLIIICGFSGE